MRGTHSLLLFHSLFLLWPFASSVVRPFRLLFVSRQAGTTGAALYVFLPTNILSIASFAVFVVDFFMALGLQHQQQHQQHHGRMHQLTGVICGYEHNFSNASHLALCPGAATAALSPVAAAIIRGCCCFWLREAFAYHSCLPAVPLPACPSSLIDCRAAIWLHYFYYPFLHYPNGMPCLFACLSR